MAWETRNGRAYYYRKRRIGRRIVSEYVGGGSVGQLAAEMDALAQAQRQERRAREQAERQKQQELDAELEEARAAVQAAVAATLQAAGFHRHKGQWRRRNGRS